MQTSPAILVQTIEEFYQQINILKPFFKHFQIDIADGIFVPNKTIQIEQIQSTIETHQSELSSLSFDFHLMVKDYEKNLKKLETLKKFINIKNVLIHVSVLNNLPEMVQNYPDFSIGLVLDTKDTVDTIRNNYDLKKIPIIQIMTIVSGFQGQPFLREMLDKIDHLRHADYRNTILLDGGVNDRTIPLISSLNNKPDGVGIGSFLTQAENIKDRIDFLKKYNCY